MDENCRRPFSLTWYNDNRAAGFPIGRERGIHETHAI